MSNLVLYRWFTEQHELLYVGITRQIGRRIKEHSKASDWSEQSSYITLERANSLNELQRKEKLAIEKEGPLHNSTYNTNPECKENITIISKKEAELLEKIEVLEIKLERQEFLNFKQKVIIQDYRNHWRSLPWRYR
jgi:predicted GIY-YIG superfamily endonuclease